MEEKGDGFTGNWRMSFSVFFSNFRSVFKLDELGLEIARIAFPAALALAADPIASLVDTAFIGQIGPVELAAVGVAIALFNQVSRIAIFPLVSVTTSFVAEEDTVSRTRTDSECSENQKLILQGGMMLYPDIYCDTIHSCRSLTICIFQFRSFLNICMKFYTALDSYEKTRDCESVGHSFEMAETKQGKKQIPSASSALIIGAILGLVQAAFLILEAKPLLSFMGVKSGSEMLHPAQKYLQLRSLGAPAVLLSLAMQGVFRGLKDTKTPLYATVVGDLMNILLDPIFMFLFKLGVTGAAISHVISQYLISLILFWRLRDLVNLVPPTLKHLQFNRFLKNGFLLLMRVISVTFCVTLSASLAARLGSRQMAAFQVCLQVWLATSLLADGLAVAGQAILASAFAREDYSCATATVSRVLQLGLALGLLLAVVLGFGLHIGARIFTQDPDVLKQIAVGIPFVAATQPINVLAFVFDGVNFGASDFAYSAYSMVTVAVISIVVLLILSLSNGFVGVWIALTIYMSLRASTGFWRIGTATGPWKFLRN